MKKSLFFLVVLFSLSGFSQSFEITPQVSYLFGGRANFIQGDIKIKDNISWGLNFAADFGYQGGAEFSYTGMVTDARFSSYDLDYTSQNFKIGVHHFQLGVYQDFGKGKVKGYGNFSLGATWFQTVNNRDISDRWSFSASLTAGLKYYFLDWLGIKAFGRLLVPMQFSGGGAYCGIGTGGASCGLGVTSYSFILQGDLGIGLIFRINR